MGPLRFAGSMHGSVVSALDRAPSLVVLLASFLTGTLLGVVARLWMRFVTTDPEFSWIGTFSIIIGFGVMFLGQAGVYLARRSRTGSARFVALRVLAIVTLLPLATAAGAFAFPIIVFAPMAITRAKWNRWLRVLFGVLALVPAVVIASIVISDLSTIRATIGVVWFALIYGMLVWAASFSFASRNDSRFTHSVGSTSSYADALDHQHP